MRKQVALLWYTTIFGIFAAIVFCAISLGTFVISKDLFEDSFLLRFFLSLLIVLYLCISGHISINKYSIKIG